MSHVRHYTLLVKQIYQDGSYLSPDFSGPLPYRETTDVFTYTSFEYDELKIKLASIHNPVIHTEIHSFNNPHVNRMGQHDWPKIGQHLLLLRDGVVMTIHVRTRQKDVGELYCEIYP